MLDVSRLAAAWLLVASLWSVAGADESAQPLQPEAADHYEGVILPALMRVCSDCHHPEDDSNPVRFLTATTRREMTGHREIWHSVAEQLRNRTMPPADAEQPTEGERLAIASWIETTLRETACDLGPYAGEPTMRRLTRTEYENTIRDLFGLTLGFDDTFPADGSGGEGFDNNGETLFLQPLLMERYVAASQEVLDAAIVSPPLDLSLKPGETLPSVKNPATLAAGRQRSAVFSVYEEQPVSLAIDLTYEAADGDRPPVLVVKLDGVVNDRVRLDEADLSKPIAVTSRLTRGLHIVSLRLNGPGSAQLRSIGIRSEVDDPAEWEVRKHQRLLGVAPGEVPEQPRKVARERLAYLLRRAFRRSVSDEEVDRFLAVYDRSIERGDPWAEAMKGAMRPVLLSPHFLFRLEPGEGAVEGEQQLVSQHALATRLAYFLTLAPPDDTLLELADAGRLHDRDVLRAQTQRLLDSPRSREFSKAFVGQWLGTHEVAGRKVPDTAIFKSEYSQHLLVSMRLEPAFFFDHVRREGRPLLELVAADYVYANWHLLEHYGLKKRRRTEPRWNHEKSDPATENWVVHELSGDDRDRRGGLLGMAAVHLISSHPNKTSPVLRGAWVLESLLGIRVPNPPPDIPDLKPFSKGKPLTVREQLEQHRADPTCAACHNLMDPLGFALEHYDVLGRWRDVDKQKRGGKVMELAIDDDATLPDGTELQGLAGLRRVMQQPQRQHTFRRHLTRQLLGFALGRSLTDRDDCVIDEIAESIQADDATLDDLVHAVVQSLPFRYRTVSPPAAAVTSR